MKYRFILALLALLVVLGSPSPREQAALVSPTITRAQAVTSLLLSRAPNLPPFDTSKEFGDLEAGAWYEAYLRSAEQYGIVEADGEGRLFPNQPVRRAEYLKMITRTFGLAENLPYLYTDVPPTAWYARYAGAAEKYRLFSKDANAFLLQPEKLMTEQESSLALESILRASGKLPEDRMTDEAREAQELSSDQAKGKLQLYLVISTQRLRVRLMNPPSSTPVGPATVEPKSLSDLRRDLMMLVNRTRTAMGLKPLRYNVMLERSAQAYAEDMARRGYFSHVSPEGETLSNRIQKGGYRDRTFQTDCRCVKGYSLAENLARGQRTPEDAMRAWMQSPSHRAAILSSEYKEIGFGISAGYWVQHFGSVVLPTDVMVQGGNVNIGHGAAP